MSSNQPSRGRQSQKNTTTNSGTEFVGNRSHTDNSPQKAQTRIVLPGEPVKVIVHVNLFHFIQSSRNQQDRADEQRHLEGVEVTSVHVELVST